MNRGYFGIGIIGGKTPENLGVLFRSAKAFEANFIFTIGCRYKRQPSDTTDSQRHIPLFEYENFEDFKKHVPVNCKIIGIENNVKSTEISSFIHPERAVYLLGAEDTGIPPNVLTECAHIVEIPTKHCLNVSVAGSILMFDRKNKSKN